MADDCCGHPADDHVMVATQGDPLSGGIRLCPSNGCDCFSTWSVEGTTRDSVVVPSLSEVRRIRLQIQDPR